MSVVKISINKRRIRPTGPSAARSVVVKRVLLRSPAVFVRVGLLSLTLERAIGHSIRQSSGISHDALTAASISCARAKLCPGGAEAIQHPCAERGGICNVHLPWSWVCLSPGFICCTYLTRFCVHSRSRFVSRAVLSPSAKFARTPFRRRWARACSSSSSCCFAFSWPELCECKFLAQMAIGHF